MLYATSIERLAASVSEQNACGHRLQKEVDEGQATRGKLLKMLHQRCTELKHELRETLSKHCTEMTFKPVQRKYAFEDGRVPQGSQWILKVSCDAAPGAVASSMSGRNFTAILGTGQTPLELLQLKRKIMGPSWLRLQAPAPVEEQAQLSWCKVEYVVQGHKSVSTVIDPGPLPPLRVAAINVKAVPDAKDKAQEIVGVSVLHMTMPMDRPLDMNAWQNAHNIRRFSVVCPTSGASCPPGLQNLVKVLCSHPLSPC